MEPEKLIGKKVYGFKFDNTENCIYDSQMDKHVGEIGTIEKIYKSDFKIQFKNDYFFYPIDQIEAHLVEDEEGVKEEIKKELSKNKVLICNSDLKVEDEIPTLSDGVMMLVSDTKIIWYKQKVIGQKNGLYYSLNEDLLNIDTWKYCEKIEPTKEEQLTAILGSSEKVSEIMELFKN